MSAPLWSHFLTPRDQAVLAASGYGALADFGQRPAFMVIDANWSFCGDRPEPILESIQRWRTACGEDSWAAITAIQPLLTLARAKGLPVIYTTNQWREDRWDAGSWAWKNSRNKDEPAGTSHASALDGNEIVTPLTPHPQDIIVRKQKPSAFFGTGLASYLTLLGCDSLIVTGGTTSGCVRATVLDAFSMNYRVNVVAEGCFDRYQASHAMSLFDMHAKYANVLSSDAIADYLRALDVRPFDLPRGADPHRPKA